MLRFPEEILLLLVNDEDGRFARVRDQGVRYALAGGVLMDLALEHRIDTDSSTLTLLDGTPTGDNLLDPTLAEIAAAWEARDVRFWLERAAERAKEIRECALHRLVANGILEEREKRFLWFFHSYRYPYVEGRLEQSVKLRIKDELFGKVIPEPRDIALIALADACGIFHQVLTEKELETVAERIEQLRKMDLIARAVTQAVWNIDLTATIGSQRQRH